ncbi:hypothetical protein [Methylobacterium sp. 17Sr1-1]|uniref:hypothetical protein n=1 Tax=Methylobacterium sp. 17Sr1-1 TaxID=2202826 RepID=UPI000D6EE060|nr:hypothetical protein [Methylobacterium sp. 17Sr1-1]AWN54411.1 hypothetical protein DK412_24625 [Methylobacterium sp. 17Sr1-1]
MSLHLQPMPIAMGSGDTESHLVFADGFLVAVLVRLSDDHEDEADMWFLEAGFGRVDDQSQPKFADLDEAQEWLQRRLDGG